MTVDHNNDGVDHIRVHQQGNTWIGRQLEIGAENAFTHPLYGWFASVLAFQLWLVYKDDLLRTITSSSITSTTVSHDHNINNFYGLSQEALTIMLEHNPTVHTTLRQTTLPLVYYDVIKDQVFVVTKYQWYIDHLNALRSTS